MITFYGSVGLNRIKCRHCGGFSIYIENDERYETCGHCGWPFSPLDILFSTDYKETRESTGVTKRKIFKKGTRLLLWRIQGGKCFYCEEYIEDYKRSHIDHFEPFVYSQNNSLENLTLSCPKCNLIKSSKCFKTGQEGKDYVKKVRQRKMSKLS